MILGGEQTVLQLLLAVVSLRRRLDIHEGNGGTHASASTFVLLTTEDLDALYAAISATQNHDDNNRTVKATTQNDEFSERKWSYGQSKF